ncbi:MAG: hypothetical protein HeimC2_18680 [Candidatus Heimdallarchaeota archaeon LC_2]|nr:MAG: hypothetical protein HeimC2_18680 [Candidatus Heimdallarchaeota archaeon LC_2]
MSLERVRKQLQLEITPDQYREIKELWKVHSIAEDNRDIPGLISTLTEDCVYIIPQTGHKWEGHDGAAAFYTELLTAFPDIDFALENIVIGPQGVFQEAHVVGTHKAKWLNMEPTQEKLEFNVTIFFPWDPVKRKFKGERVYSDLYIE